MRVISNMVLKMGKGNTKTQTGQFTKVSGQTTKSAGLAKKFGNQDKYITGNGIRIRWKDQGSLSSKMASLMKVSFRTIRSLAMVCINGQMGENIAAGGIKVSSMAMGYSLTTEAKVNMAFGKRAIALLG